MSEVDKINEEILLYMGGTINKVSTFGYKYVYNGIGQHVLGFHRSWDLLMPVIKKIDSEANTELSFEEFDNYRNTWVMIDKPSKYDISYVHRQIGDYLINKKVV